MYKMRVFLIVLLITASTALFAQSGGNGSPSVQGQEQPAPQVAEDGKSAVQTAQPTAPPQNNTITIDRQTYETALRANESALKTSENTIGFLKWLLLFVTGSALIGFIIFLVKLAGYNKTLKEYKDEIQKFSLELQGAESELISTHANYEILCDKIEPKIQELKQLDVILDEYKDVERKIKSEVATGLSKIDSNIETINNSIATNEAKHQEQHRQLEKLMFSLLDESFGNAIDDINNGNYQEAIDKLNPLTGYSEIKYVSYYHLGKCHYELGNYTIAIQNLKPLFDKECNLITDNLDLYELIFDCSIKQDKISGNHEKIEEFLELIESHIKLEPQNIVIYLMKAKSLEYLNKPKKAIETIEEIESINQSGNRKNPIPRYIIYDVYSLKSRILHNFYKETKDKKHLEDAIKALYIVDGSKPSILSRVHSWNLIWTEALLGRNPKTTLEYLRKYLEDVPSNLFNVIDNPDFDSIKNLPEYQELVDEYMPLAEEERDRIQERAKNLSTKSTE